MNSRELTKQICDLLELQYRQLPVLRATEEERTGYREGVQIFAASMLAKIFEIQNYHGFYQLFDDLYNRSFTSSEVLFQELISYLYTKNINLNLPEKPTPPSTILLGEHQSFASIGRQ